MEMGRCLESKKYGNRMNVSSSFCCRLKQMVNSQSSSWPAGDGDGLDRSPSSSEKMRNLIAGQVRWTPPPSLSLALSASTRHPPQADKAPWGPAGPTRQPPHLTCPTCIPKLLSFSGRRRGKRGRSRFLPPPHSPPRRNPSPASPPAVVAACPTPSPGCSLHILSPPPRAPSRSPDPDRPAAMSKARVYTDVNVLRPKEYWDYEALTVQWGSVIIPSRPLPRILLPWRA